MKNAFRIVIGVVALSLAAPTGLIAGETGVTPPASDGIREALTANKGKSISVKTDSGEALEGTVTRVGDTIVHLERLTGRDFYDAVIRIDRISSVIFRARGN